MKMPCSRILLWPFKIFPTTKGRQGVGIQTQNKVGKRVDVNGLMDSKRKAMEECQKSMHVLDFIYNT
jgi:hypothetical protein